MLDCKPPLLIFSELIQSCSNYMRFLEGDFPNRFRGLWLMIPNLNNSVKFPNFPFCLAGVHPSMHLLSSRTFLLELQYIEQGY